MDRLGWLATVGLVLAAGLAGCLGDEAPGPVPSNRSVPASEPSTSTGFAYACPEGEEAEGDAEVCVGTFANRTRSYQEVVAAADRDAGQVAVAAIEWRTNPVSPDGAVVSRIGVFHSDDGGRSWSPAAEVPAPELGTGGQMYDPSLTFAPDGTLHLNAMWMQAVRGPGEFQSPEMYHVAGQTPTEAWGQPSLLTEDGDNDRGWIEVHPEGGPVIAWQNTDAGSTELAWLGGGWGRQDEGPTVEDCAEHTPPRVVDGRVVVACVDEAEGAGLRVFAFEPDDARLEQIATVPAIREPDRAVRPRATVTADGTLVVAGVGDEGPLVASSPDGANWSEPVPLFERLSVDDGWSDPSVWAMRADPWGAVHLVVRSHHESTAFSMDQPAHELAHVALDPADWTVLAEQPLASWDPEDPSDRRVPGSTALAAPDDTAGLAFLDGRGMAFWQHDKAIDYTVIEPQFEQPGGDGSG